MMAEDQKAQSDVTVWIVPISWAFAMPSHLDNIEKERFARMSQPRAQAFMVGRSLLKSLIAVRTDCDLGEVSIPQHSSGALGAVYGLSLSLSHTRTHVAAAVSSAPSLGVDIEAFDRSLDIARMVERRFPPYEARLVMSCLQEGHILEARRRFAFLWSAKEALVKARDGQLLSILAESILPPADKPQWEEPPSLWRAEGKGREWIVVEDLMALGHSFALACGPHKPDVTIRCFSDHEHPTG